MDKNEIEIVKKKYALTEEELEQMYEKIKTLIFKDYKRNKENPIAVVTGGQPGAGKSSVVIKSVEDFKQAKKDVIILDVDTYRGLYPNAIEIAQNYPELYSEITDGAVGKIMGRLIKDAISGGYNFIFEGTMGKSADIVDKLRESPKGYTTVTRLMAVSREESLLSIFERYLEMIKNMGIGRLTTIEAHDIRYEGFVTVAKTLESKGAQVEVYERGENLESPKLIYKTNSTLRQYASVYEAILGGRNSSRRKCMENVEERLNKIRSDIEICLPDDEEVRREFEKLREIVETLAKNNGAREND